ncbi:thiamine-binding protein [Staphylococcus hyicus]|uniref:thiamine-binding protein n=1 Tax=Staphylococcus hyicus TaxID=1284 RepID=UPI001F420151|nr:MTH1187 family thiamine-binding protein [Staphylococcus hyicus]MCE5153123.1 thiamine-binding protein [Staphylococcus hyicus]MCQ9290601.1 MTH1187 family thiamine-binding protein [Staphylococcus hyicus]MCQ9305843.1 MTH1187 family thiamine-binding protein [Staphylococcus hyicus]MCQ9308255.1 MTH1187 family thiamine-binding protein [Staphylococcus hyicus]MCQ9310677.1 MTH1187 family thiamine-binding protein [Staphylococcus hyicus]
MIDTLMSIQIITKTPNGKDVIPFVDEAIAIIEKSGLKYRVGPLETTIEGDMSELLILIQQMNERMVELEVESVISQVKFYHAPEGISMSTLTEKYDDI